MNGEELKREREKMGLTQAELAALLDVAAPLNPGKKIYEWERGVYRCPALLPLALEAAQLRLKKKRRRR